ncbi:hypothetical protein PWT90_10850 [Aphanocladium album]|nr:hypothetical protein PWT90_10850 [Aphanocladium album]
MVTLTEVEDEHFQEHPGAQYEDDEDYTDTESEISNDSDFDAENETFAERLYALRDIVPPQTRSWISDSVSTVGSRAWSIFSFGSKATWVITTSALFIGVPFALSYNEDLQYAAMEQEYSMRQQGGDMLTAGGEEQSTADKVTAALAAEGQSGQAKPAL